jgi:hypothetical protein
MTNPAKVEEWIVPTDEDAKRRPECRYRDGVGLTARRGILVAVDPVRKEFPFVVQAQGGAVSRWRHCEISRSAPERAADPEPDPPDNRGPAVLVYGSVLGGFRRIGPLPSDSPAEEEEAEWRPKSIFDDPRFAGMIPVYLKFTDEAARQKFIAEHATSTAGTVDAGESRNGECNASTRLPPASQDAPPCVAPGPGYRDAKFPDDYQERIEVSEDGNEWAPAYLMRIDTGEPKPYITLDYNRWKYARVPLPAAPLPIVTPELRSALGPDGTWKPSPPVLEARKVYRFTGPKNENCKVCYVGVNVFTQGKVFCREDNTAFDLGWQEVSRWITPAVGGEGANAKVAGNAE